MPREEMANTVIGAQTQFPNMNNTDFGVWTSSDWILNDKDVKVPPGATIATEEYWRPKGWALGKKRVFEEEGDDTLKNVLRLFSSHIIDKIFETGAGQLGYIATTENPRQGQLYDIILRSFVCTHG